MSIFKYSLTPINEQVEEELSRSASHLHGLDVEQVLSEHRQKVLAHVLTQLFQRAAARRHAAGYALQGAPKLLLGRRPAGVDRAVLAQFR